MISITGLSADTNSNSKIMMRHRTKLATLFLIFSIAWLFQRIHEERKNGKLPIVNSMSLYTIIQPSLNYCSYFNILSKSLPVILHTTNKYLYPYNHTISFDIATPQTFSFSYYIFLPVLCTLLMP